MKIDVSKEDITEFQKDILNWFGKTNLKTAKFEDIKKTILYLRLINNIKNCKKGDIIYRFDEYKEDIESKKEYVVFSIKENLFGGKDIMINKGNGYIAGGLNGKAVLKEDYEQYLSEIEGLKCEN